MNNETNFLHYKLDGFVLCFLISCKNVYNEPHLNIISADPIRKIRDLQQSAILARTIAISQNKLDNIVLRQFRFYVFRILCLRKSSINMHFAKVQIMVKFVGILIWNEISLTKWNMLLLCYNAYQCRITNQIILFCLYHVAHQVQCRYFT